MRSTQPANSSTSRIIPTLSVLLAVGSTGLLQAAEPPPIATSPGSVTTSPEVRPAPTLPPVPAERFINQFTTYEPVYFLVDPGIGSEPLNAKFQFSFAFRITGDKAARPTQPDQHKDGLYFSYSQTSFWDLDTYSAPFYDNSYRPELWWHQNLDNGILGGDRVAVEGGFGHESNGQPVDTSRSLNHLFARLLADWRTDDLLIEASPRARVYIGDLSDNPDLPEYRGYVDLEGLAVLRGSWALRAKARVGSQWDKASLQLDLSHPLDTWTDGWVDGLLYAQTFIGWSESLLDYNQKTEQPRILIGYGLIR